MQPPKIKCIDLKMEFQVSIAMATKYRLSHADELHLWFKVNQM